MKERLFRLGLLVFVLVALSGCDSGQYGQEAKTEPKAEAEPMEKAPAPAAEEMAAVAGALMAPDGAAGAAENAEGVDHFNQGHYDVAQEHFAKAIAANADLAEGHYNLALALDKLNEHGEATSHFKKALELAPEDPRIRDSGILKAHVSG